MNGHPTAKAQVFFESDIPGLQISMCSCYTSQFELLGNHHYGSLHCHLPCAWLTGTTVKSASVTFPLNYPWMLKLYSTGLASTIVNTGSNSLDTEIVWQLYNKMIQNIVIVIFKIIIEMKWHKFLRDSWYFWVYYLWPVWTQILHWANGIKIKLSNKKITLEKLPVHLLVKLIKLNSTLFCLFQWKSHIEWYRETALEI